MFFLIMDILEAFLNLELSNYTFQHRAIFCLYWIIPLCQYGLKTCNEQQIQHNSLSTDLSSEFLSQLQSMNQDFSTYQP